MCIVHAVINFRAEDNSRNVIFRTV
jgi:hypothetical protein